MSKLRSRRSTFLSFQPPAVGEEEIEAVAETLRSGWLTSGPRAEELERRFAEYVGAQHAVALSSGTAAMHLSLVAAGVGPGDEVITTPITWPATANVIVHCGATPVFADVRESDLNLDPGRAAELTTERTKAIMPVHLAGQPCDLEPLWALGLPVIEDAAHAAEASYRGRKLGGLAAIALVQLDKVERHGEIRRRQFARYDEAVAGLAGIRALERDPRDTHAHHLYVVRIDPEGAGASRDDYQRALAE